MNPDPGSAAPRTASQAWHMCSLLEPRGSGAPTHSCLRPGDPGHLHTCPVLCTALPLQTLASLAALHPDLCHRGLWELCPTLQEVVPRQRAGHLALAPRFPSGSAVVSCRGLRGLHCLPSLSPFVSPQGQAGTSLKGWQKARDTGHQVSPTCWGHSRPLAGGCDPSPTQPQPCQGP